MLSRFIKSIFVLFICSIQLFAQTPDRFLISIDLGTQINLNKLEELSLPFYHIFDGTLIAGLSADKIENIKDSKIPYRILDQYPSQNKYYIISNKTGKSEFALQSGQIIFQNSQSRIIKNFLPDAEEITKKGLTCVEMKLKSIQFKNEKIITKTNSTQGLDSLINSVISEVNPDSIRYFIQSLQNFGTRFLLASTRDTVASWIKYQFIRMGYTDVKIDSFRYNNTWQKNVVATLPGVKSDEDVFVVGGHHDSYSWNPMTYAPGADDNASGTTAALEMARVFKAKNYQPENTVKFVTFAAEEYGLFGSYDFAQKALASGMSIRLMLNHDMISYTNRPLSSSRTTINYYNGSEDFTEIALYCIDTYTPLTSDVGAQNASFSDSYSFWAFGFPSVYFEESDFSPYYHSPYDVISNYNMEYCAEVIKASAATLISASVIPAKVQGFDIVDMGNGNSLLLNWLPSAETDVIGYHIYLGTSSGNYGTIFTTSETSMILSDLTEGTKYYIGISAFDTDNFESLILEKTFTPRSIPLAPSGLTGHPQWHQVELQWLPSPEFDILGYNIYRSSELLPAFEKLNSSIITDTLFTDNTTQNGNYYYYSVSALDSLLNESILSESIKSRAVSMDQGILVVDETFDGNGLIFNPTDEEVDSFYSSLLVKFGTDIYDINKEEVISLADLGAYSTIIWHGDDSKSMNLPLTSTAEIRKYLDLGGKFLYTGYLPTEAFSNSSEYPHDFISGDFVFDYLKIKHTEKIFGSKFIGALPFTANYSEIYVDTTKTRESSNYHLSSIQSIGAATGGTEIYGFDTYYDTSTPQGSMKNMPVGIEYLGSDFKIIALSFPLFYMNFDQAKSFIDYILTEKFNEVTPVRETVVSIPEKYHIAQNYPNPFNPSTIIEYQLPEQSHIKLTVYDILGREVKTIVNEFKNPGNYKVEFNASDMATGIYFYRIVAGNFTAVKRMLLLK